MQRKSYHVTQKQDGSWQGKLPHAERASVVAPTKEAALKATIEMAKAASLGQVVIHKSREHGSGIQSERTYGKDPTKYPG